MIWWRRGELNGEDVFKIGKLLILSDAKNAKNDQYA